MGEIQYLQNPRNKTKIRREIAGGGVGMVGRVGQGRPGASGASNIPHLPPPAAM